MKRTKDDPRYKQAVAENEGDAWYADTIVAPRIEPEIVSASKAAFAAEWSPVFEARRAAWNESVKSNPSLTVPQRESLLGFTFADLVLAKKELGIK